jgi:hypothetical protein
MKTRLLSFLLLISSLSINAQNWFEEIKIDSLVTAIKPDVSINIYPNPINQFISINGEFDEYIVIDLQGREISKNEIDPQKLTNGVYFIRFRRGILFITKRIIVVH